MQDTIVSGPQSDQPSERDMLMALADILVLSAPTGPLRSQGAPAEELRNLIGQVHERAKEIFSRLGGFPVKLYEQSLEAYGVLLAKDELSEDEEHTSADLERFLAIYEAATGMNRMSEVVRADLQRRADAAGIPGPSVRNHPANYDGECYCQECALG